ncbi:thiamine phosphate synthase [Arenimonas sp.]|jgi:thiamine-phosphate pyrophosphorylase|uniref:thiamine phosphate synthase n=1 Tax=Arenimonas sp. TaxID=1872635 RepID=UPI0037C0B533
MPSRLQNRRGVYLITPDVADTGELEALCSMLLQHPVALLQYRNKSAATALKHRQGKALWAVCRNAGVPLLINDDWRLAAELGADGVHLGRDDTDPGTVREALGNQALIGVSCYNEMGRAHDAAVQDIDYLAFGAVFPSPTKPLASQAPLHLFAEARALGKAMVAIGGIRPDNSAQLCAAGADFIAVISGVFDAPDPVAALIAYNHSFSKVTP